MPHHPGREARDAQAEGLAHGVAVPDQAEKASGVVAEGLGRAPRDHSLEVFRQLLSLGPRELGQRGRDAVVLGIGARRAISQRPDVSVALDLQGAIDLYTAPRKGETGIRDQGVHAVAHGRDHRACVDVRPARKTQAAGIRSLHPHAGLDVHAACLQFPVGESSEFLREWGEDAGAALEQVHLDLLRADARVEGSGVQQEIQDRCRYLDAREAAAHHRHREQGTLSLRTLGQF